MKKVVEEDEISFTEGGPTNGSDVYRGTKTRGIFLRNPSVNSREELPYSLMDEWFTVRRVLE